VISFVWNFLSIDFNIIKFDWSLSKFLKIVFEKNSKSKCCQKCIKFLIENSSFKCVFTWIVSSAIVANVSMLSAWLYECR
jgi:hypothetical protein